MKRCVIIHKTIQQKDELDYKRVAPYLYTVKFNKSIVFTEDQEKNLNIELPYFMCQCIDVYLTTLHELRCQKKKRK